MRVAKLWVLAALPLAAACGGDTGGDDAPLEDTTSAVGGAAPTSDPMMADTGMPAGGHMMGMATLASLNDSGVTGEASLSESGGQTQVVLTLRGAGAGASHAAHIHNGTCDALGPVVAPLQQVTTDGTGTGNSTSTVSEPLDRLTGGSFVVAAHGAGGAPVACGAIGAHQM